MDTRPDRDETAALNNAAWCAAVWRAHGLAVEQAEGIWFCRGRPPRFYPHAVTVERAADPAKQGAFIGGLGASDPDPLFSVKDSFAALELREAGLTPLFDARWLWREPSAGDEAIAPDGWRHIRDPADLAAWEDAWRGDAPSGPRIFRPDLLSDPRSTVLGRFGPSNAIQGGALVHDAAGVAGLSNVFGDYAEAVRAAAATHPDRPIVGYERGEALAAALARGFTALGPLRVWTRGG